MTTGAPIPRTPARVSVNRVRVVDLPGIPIDEEARGQQAYHLVSVLAMTRYAHERAADLRLPGSFFDDGPETRARLPRFISETLASPDPVARAAASAIVARLGRNLGHVLLTLRRGDPVNRAARDEWSDEEWGYWASVRRVWLAGGMVHGELGRRIRDEAAAWLASAGSEDRPAVAISPFLGNAALLGAARYLPPAAGVSLCCDFGHTAVKRAVARVDGGRLREFVSLPALPVEGAWHMQPDPDLRRAGGQYAGFVVDAICDGFARARAAGYECGPHVMFCVAAYVDGGRLLGNGSYATIERARRRRSPVPGGRNRRPRGAASPHLPDSRRYRGRGASRGRALLRADRAGHCARRGFPARHSGPLVRHRRPDRDEVTA